jgi:hypothetical protein
MLAPGYDFGVITPKLTADLSPTNSTVTLADITGLGLAVGIGTYDFDFVLPFSSATTGAGLVLTLNGPASSFVSFILQIQSQTSTVRFGWRGAYGATDTGSNAATANATFLGRITGRVITTSAGTLNAQYASSVAGVAITIKSGAYATLTPR